MTAGSSGGARISFSLGSRPEDRRPHARARLDDDEDDDEPQRNRALGVKRQRTGHDPKRCSAPVIPMPSTTDWRKDRMRRLGLLDRYTHQLGSLGSLRNPDAKGTIPTPSHALNSDVVSERAFTEQQKEGLVLRQAQPAERDATPPAEEAGASPPPPEPEPESADDAAVRALLAGSQGGVRSDRVIVQPREEDMLRSDVDTHPEAPTLDDYSSMPVKEFGAAMLRGMGWQDGSGVGRTRSGPARAPEVQRRTALLGLGAKERVLPSSRPLGRRDEGKYMPAFRRDGERYAEERHEYRRNDHRDRDRYEDRRDYRSRDDRRDRYSDERRDVRRRDEHREDTRRPSRDDRRSDYRGDPRDDRRSGYRSDLYR